MKLSLFPLHTVLFPGMALPLHIFEPRYRKMINTCLDDNSPFGVVLIRAGSEVGGPAAPYAVGTFARVSRAERLPDGRMNIEAVGEERFRIRELKRGLDDGLCGTVESFPLATPDDHNVHAAARVLAPWLEHYLELLGQAAATRFAPKRLPDDPIALAYLAAIVAQIPMREKQGLLSITSAADLLRQERALYRREISLLRAMLASPQARDHGSLSPN